MLSRKNKKSKEKDGCQQSIETSYDISSREYIEKLVRFIRNKNRR